MPQYMLLVYEEEVGPEAQAEREVELPAFVDLHRELRAAGVLVGVKALRPTASSTSVRVRAGAVDITDGPFATTKEMLAGYYVVDCADLEEAQRYAARVPASGWGTVEVRPVVPSDEWFDAARRNGVDVTPEDRAEMR